MQKEGDKIEELEQTLFELPARSAQEDTSRLVCGCSR